VLTKYYCRIKRKWFNKCWMACRYNDNLFKCYSCGEKWWI